MFLMRSSNWRRAESSSPSSRAGCFRFVGLPPLPAGGAPQPVFEAVLLQLVENASLPREIAQQHPLPVPDQLRADVFVGARILENRAHVHAAFVRAGAWSHVVP